MTTSGYDGSIRIDSSISSDGFNKGIQGIVNSVKGVAAAVGIAFGVGAIVAFGKSAVDAASQMANALTGLKSILDAQGRSFTEAKAFIDSYTEDGLIPATNAIAAYKNLATRGFATAEIEKLMLIMKDSAAFNRQSGLSMGEAVERASSGLRQENSLLTDSVGIQKNVARMWDDHAKKIGTTAQNLTLAQKRQAELNGFAEEAKYFLGDAAKVANTYSGKVAALSAAFLDLRVAIGDAIIPLLAQIIPYMTEATNRLTVMFNTIAQIIQAFFGYDPSATTAAAEAAAEAAQKGADAQGELAKNTEEAKKAAKGSLATFDELNVLQEKQAAPEAPETNEGNKDKGSGGGISAGIMAQVESFKKWLADMVAPLQEPFERLKKAIFELGGTIWDGLKWAWDNILAPLGKWLLQQAAPVFLDMFTARLGLLNEVLIALKPAGLWLWENFLKPAAAWTGQAIIDALTWITARLNDLSALLHANPTAFSDFANRITAALAPIAGWVNDNVIKPIGGAFSNLIESLKFFGNWFANDVWPFIRYVLGNIGENFRVVFATVANIIRDIIPIITGVVSGIVNILSGIITFLVGVFSGDWKKAWEGITKIYEGIMQVWQSVIRGAANIIIDIINGLLQLIVLGLNNAIERMNMIQVVIPEWVPGFGGQSWGVNIPTIGAAPQIPRLATGAIIPPNAEFAAILGDQRSGRNLEAPEGLIRQIIQEELGNIQADIKIEFGGSLGALVRELKPYLDKENVRIGGNLIRGKATS